MLTVNDRGGLSAEEAVALQKMFCQDIPATREAIEQDKLGREHGLAGMSTARLGWLDDQKEFPSGAKEQAIQQSKEALENQKQNLLNPPTQCTHQATKPQAHNEQPPPNAIQTFSLSLNTKFRCQSSHFHCSEVPCDFYRAHWLIC